MLSCAFCFPSTHHQTLLPASIVRVLYVQRVERDAMKRRNLLYCRKKLSFLALQEFVEIYCSAKFKRDLFARHSATVGRLPVMRRKRPTLSLCIGANTFANSPPNALTGFSGVPNMTAITKRAARISNTSALCHASPPAPPVARNSRPS